MNNKEFLTQLSQRSGYRMDDVQAMARNVVCAIVDTLGEGEPVSVADLGMFDVKKRSERIIQNPGTGQKMLVPPKIVATFKPFK